MRKASIICPNCGNDKSGVVDVRSENGDYIRRRRKCKKCGTSYTTYELSASAYNKYESMRQLYVEMKNAILKIQTGL